MVRNHLKLKNPGAFNYNYLIFLLVFAALKFRVFFIIALLMLL